MGALQFIGEQDGPVELELKALSVASMRFGTVKDDRVPGHGPAWRAVKHGGTPLGWTAATLSEERK